MHGGRKTQPADERDATGLTAHRKVFSSRHAALATLAVLALSLGLLGTALSNVFASTSASGSLAQQGAKLTGGAEESGEGRFGHDVALSGDGATVLVGAPDDDGEIGAAWVFTRSGSGSEATWVQQGPELTGGGEESGEGHFGGSVALSAEGDTALVGAPRDDDGFGAVWVFTRSGLTWTRQAKLTGGAQESASGGWFGDSVALSADGDTALVSAPVDHGDTGAVWVFTRSGLTWTRQAKLTGGAEEQESGWFGGSVALSADGNTALIGDPADAGKVGAAWVFTRSGSGADATWGQLGTKLIGREEEGEGRFGASVALSGDGDTALVGGRSNASGSGAAWVFTRSGGDTGSGAEATWVQQGAELTGSEAAGGEGSSGEGSGGEGGSEAGGNEAGSKEEAGGEEESGQGRFGGSVSLSGDGDTALVGARNDSNGHGAVWVFARSGSTWTRQGAKLTGAEEQGKGQFGYSVALSADAQTAAIGGVADHGRAGAAWMFVQPPSVESPSTEPPPPTTTSGQSASTTSSSPSSNNTTTSSAPSPPKLGVKSFKAAAGHVRLVSATLPVRPGRRADTQLATVKLECLAAGACRGAMKLTIVVRAPAARAGKSGKSGKPSPAIRLGVVSFALRAGETAAVRLMLDAAGRARLRFAHGRMAASLTIVASTPRSRTQVHAVRLVRKQARPRA